MDRATKQSLLEEKAALEKRLKEINRELIEDDRLHMSSPRLSRRHVEDDPDDMPDSVDQPLRKVLMDMLYEVDYMLTNDMIIHLYEARYKEGLELSRLDRLSHDELHRKNALNTTVYGLTHPIQLFEDHIIRIKSIWVPSDWPVGDRVYLPTTDKLINLHFLDWYITRYHSKSFQYLKSEAISSYVQGIVEELELEDSIQPPYDSIKAKKVTVQEIEATRKMEEDKFSNLAFRTLSAHQQEKKDFDPILDAKTDMS